MFSKNKGENMYALNLVGDFLLSEWLWGVTFGWSYIFINLLLMTFFFRRLLRLSWFRSILLSISAHSFSFFVYSGLVIGFFMHLLQWWYVPNQYEVVAGPFIASLSLGLIHVLLQILFFVLIRKVYKIDITWALVSIFVSSGFSVFLSYWYIVKFMKEVAQL